MAARSRSGSTAEMRNFDPETDRLVAITLDPNTIVSIDPDQVHERKVAIFDLLEDNRLAPVKPAGSHAS